MFGSESTTSNSVSMKKPASIWKEQAKSNLTKLNGNSWLLLAKGESVISKKHLKFIKLSTKNTLTIWNVLDFWYYSAKIWDSTMKNTHVN